jgi:hypothetical protein
VVEVGLVLVPALVLEPGLVLEPELVPDIPLQIMPL